MYFCSFEITQLAFYADFAAEVIIPSAVKSV